MCLVWIHYLSNNIFHTFILFLRKNEENSLPTNHLEESKIKRVSKAWNSIVNFCRKERISRIKIQNNKITFQERTK